MTGSLSTAHGPHTRPPDGTSTSYRESQGGVQEGERLLEGVGGQHSLVVELARLSGSLSKRRLVYRFFPNLPLASLEFRVFSRDIGIFFSAIENAEYMVIPRVSQADYLRIMRQGDLTLDSAHWGSCNSAVDSLAVGIPVVALEGKLWHSRVAAAILRRLSLPELVAESETEFEDRVLALTDNETYRRAVTEALLLAELSDDVLSGTDRHWLRTTFHYLIEHHGGDETIMPIRMRSMCES